MVVLIPQRLIIGWNQIKNAIRIKLHKFEVSSTSQSQTTIGSNLASKQYFFATFLNLE